MVPFDQGIDDPAMNRRRTSRQFQPKAIRQFAALRKHLKRRVRFGGDAASSVCAGLNVGSVVVPRTEMVNQRAITVTAQTKAYLVKAAAQMLGAQASAGINAVNGQASIRGSDNSSL